MFMKASKNLEYIADFSDEEYDGMWNNVFEGKENDEYVNKYVPMPVNDKEGLRMFLRGCMMRRTSSVWLIKRKKQTDFIGFLIHGNFWLGLKNNFGLNIGLKFKGHGYGTEALGSLIEHLRGEGYRETFALCMEENTAIRRTMENNGFECLGRTGMMHRGMHEMRYRRAVNCEL